MFLIAWSILPCSILRARASSCSVSGVFIIFSNLNRFVADIGGQLRMTTMSCCRSTVIWRSLWIEKKKKQKTGEAGHGPLCSSWTRYFLLRSICWIPGSGLNFFVSSTKRTNLSGQLVNYLPRNGHRSCLVHKPSLGNDAIECHRRHFGLREEAWDCISTYQFRNLN